MGAGPVGLATGLLLGRAGHRALVVDRLPRGSPHPKARGVRLRGSELLRVWGMDEPLRAQAMPGESQRFIYGESVCGREIARTRPIDRSGEVPSSAAPYRVPQDVLEEILASAVAAFAPAVQLRRGAEVVSTDQDADGVAARVRDVRDGEMSTVRARYLLACDGVGSSVRAGLGLSLGERGTRQYWHSILWRGDLAELTRGRPAIVYYTRAGDEALVGIGAAGRGDRWVTFVQYPALTVRPEPMTEAAAVDITRRAVGRPDLPLTVLGMATFRIGADVVDRYRVGRVFLVGDSAHTLPPTGGFGINTGFGDAHNLVWKLSWVLRGVAPDELLDTYQRRTPAGRRLQRRLVLAQRAAAGGHPVGLPGRDSDELQRLVDEQTAHVDPLAQDIGFSYRPIPSGKSPITTLVIGARAPHATVVVDGARADAARPVRGPFDADVGRGG